MKAQTLVLIAALTTQPLLVPANAAGCLKGAAVGGVAGHYEGHHAILGAISGCVIGRHMAAKQRREEEQRRQAAGTFAHGTQGNRATD